MQRRIRQPLDNKYAAVRNEKQLRGGGGGGGTRRLSCREWRRQLCSSSAAAVLRAGGTERVFRRSAHMSNDLGVKG